MKTIVQYCFEHRNGGFLSYGGSITFDIESAILFNNPKPFEELDKMGSISLKHGKVVAYHVTYARQV